jgi:hypothetical protein
MNTTLDPSVWGPHYWFFLHTISLTYPKRPNDITKKKYYDFVQNIPLFIPVESMATNFSKLLDEYPITPYLDSRDAFVRWMHFIHNKINEQTEKEKISLGEFYAKYYEQYKPKEVEWVEYYKVRSKIIYFIVISLCLVLIFNFYNK